jgi:uncharacterized protein GlcG (DUF336 family)
LFFRLSFSRAKEHDVTGITLDLATSIINSAAGKADELELNPLGIAVLDSGGHLISFVRQDGASAGRFQIAMAKAAGALFMGFSSRQVGEIAAQRPIFISSVAQLAPAGLIPTAGGIIVVDNAGAVIGAVGISGDTPENDEICVLAGIASAGLKAQG